MPDVIYTYNEYQRYSSRDSLFWIVEYKDVTETYRYSLLRNECLMYPADFKQRLNDGVYRIWTTTPRDLLWGEES